MEGQRVSEQPGEGSRKRAEFSGSQGGDNRGDEERTRLTPGGAVLVWKSHWGLLARRPPGGTAQGRPEVSGVTWGTFGPLTELALPVEVPLGGSLQGNSPLGTGPSVWQDILAVPRAPRAPTRPGGWGSYLRLSPGSGVEASDQTLTVLILREQGHWVRAQRPHKVNEGT